MVNDNFEDGRSLLRVGPVNPLHVSRRDFCRTALAASWFVAAGLPVRALHKGGGAPANVRVSHDGYSSHGEPCLAVNPRNPRNLFAACMLPVGAATYASFDGGLSWQSNGPLPLPAGIEGAGDVSAGFDAAGSGFVCGLMVASGGIKGANRTVGVWRTEDGGRTFTAPVAVTGQGALDRPWLATERRRPRALHVVWSEGTDPRLTTALGYARSDDGGRTFETPRTIVSMANGLGDVMVACGTHGDVYTIGTVGFGAGAADPDTPSTATVISSHDRGQTFDPPIELGQGTDLVSFPGISTASSSVPAIAAHPHRHLVCAAFTVQQAGADHADILLAASRDGGRTWSPAAAVTPQDSVIYFQPQVAIDDGGRIAVMAFAMAKGKVSVVLMLSEPGSLRFGSPITITSQSFDPAKVADQGGDWWIGDYQALAATPDAFHPLWNDARTGQLELFTAAVRK